MKKDTRQRIERALAIEFGTWAKYPTKPVMRRFFEWQERDRYISFIREEHARQPLRNFERDDARYTKQRDRLKVPAGYLSWQHIQAFYYFEVGARRLDDGTKRAQNMGCQV